jgi:hypothetical protein
MINTNEELKQGILDIIECFDFDKVHKYMTDINWTWYHEGGVPSIPELKRTAVRLLVEAVEDKTEITSVGTGGFRVYKFPWGLEMVFCQERKGTF